MTRELTRQRIAYLIEHGGLYDPDKSINSPRWRQAAVLSTSLLLAVVAVEVWFR